jgi:uncharacterized protein involved in tolerance to divalent cations
MLPGVEALMRSLHGYEMPEIIAVPVPPPSELR